MRTALVRNTLRYSAIKLRRQGYSYSAINKKLLIPKSTLSGWFKKEPWSESLKLKLSKKNSSNQVARLWVMSKVNKVRFELSRQKARNLAVSQFDELIKDKLFLAGIMAYSGEGDSKLENSIVRIANTDPRMIKLFCNFLFKVCKIKPEKIRVALILYPDLIDLDCRDYWSEITKVPVSQFHKTQFIKGKHPTNRLKFGICYVIVCSRELKEKLLVWIDLCYKSL